jgi:hypothetical protein
MSPFAWFAITLTVAFIIYYTVMIMNDALRQEARRTKQSGRD